MQPWEMHCTDIQRVGSRETCNPPPLDTDEDWLLLVNIEEYPAFHAAVVEQYEQTSQEGYQAEDGTISPFTCFRFEDKNLIVTTNKGFFDRFMQANRIAKNLNLLDKSDRIALFQRILYNASPTINSA